MIRAPSMATRFAAPCAPDSSAVLEAAPRIAGAVRDADAWSAVTAASACRALAATAGGRTSPDVVACHVRPIASTCAVNCCTPRVPAWVAARRDWASPRSATRSSSTTAQNPGAAAPLQRTGRAPVIPYAPTALPMVHALRFGAVLVAVLALAGPLLAVDRGAAGGTLWTFLFAAWPGLAVALALGGLAQVIENTAPPKTRGGA